MKLTKAQEDVMAIAKQTITDTRKYDTFDEYFSSLVNVKESDTSSASFIRFKSSMEKIYEGIIKGIVPVTASTSTLNKLQTLGLIEIIEKKATGSTLVKIKSI